MKKGILSITLLMQITALNAQQEGGKTAAGAVNEIIWGTGVTNGNGLKPGEIVVGIPLPPGDVIGNEFLYDDWVNATVTLFETENNIALPFKYNLRSNEAHVKYRNEVYAVEGARIKEVVWTMPVANQPVRLVNCKYLAGDAASIQGLFEMLQTGTYSLYKRVRLEIKRPTYNAALQTGSRDTEILKREEYYYAGSDNVAIRIKNKKSLAGVLQLPGVSNFTKTNGLTFKTERDLMMLFSFINQKPVNP
jgi:hypothetical protein